MGLLDEVGKALGGGALSGSGLGGAMGGGGQAALLQALMGLLGGGGGLDGLLRSFQQKGLGDLVGSWVSTGPNLPASAEQIATASAPTSCRSSPARPAWPPARWRATSPSCSPASSTSSRRRGTCRTPAPWAGCWRACWAGC